MDTVKLNNGVQMPILGFGVYQIEPQDCVRCVLNAIEVGYRAIDTAQAYGNEHCVGEAIQKCGLPREELFITTKIWLDKAGYEKAKAAIEESLKNLQSEYIDLLLVHQPFGDYYGTYKAMTEAYKQGKIRAIGVSNFYPDRFVDLVENCEIIPAVNQVETHVFNQQIEPQKIMTEYGTATTSWSSFAEGKNDFFNNQTLKKIGEKHNKSVAQVALRFLIQRGIAVIPKTTGRERMMENINVFDFELSEQDMQKIYDLDQAQSLFFSHYDPKIVKWLNSMK